jgi:hypothetical protein
MKNIGLLVTKNEAPILEDILRHNATFINEIFVLDGGNDEAPKILRNFPQIKAYHHEREFVPEGYCVKDGIRKFIFDKILETAEEGDWITLMHGDEMFYHDPNISIAVSEKKGCNLVRWYAAHFFPHKNDYKNWETLKWLPVHERFTYYAHYKNGCWIEDRQFRIVRGMKYNIDRHSGVLPVSPVPYIPLQVYPIYRHFKVWNLSMESYQAEHSEKYGKTVFRPAGKWGLVHYTPKKIRDFFIRKYPKYPRVSKFDGSFGHLAEGFEKIAAETVGDHVLNI